MQELLSGPTLATARWNSPTRAARLRHGVAVPRQAQPSSAPQRKVRIAYFIASHVNPAQVARLVRACRSGSPESRVLIHHDYNVSNLDPKTLGSLDNIDFLTGQPAVQWGMFSMCAMVLRHMRWLLDHREFDWVYYLSGQDYPIQPLREIESFLSQTPYDGFVSAQPVDEVPWAVGAMRYLYQYKNIPRFPGRERVKAWIDRYAQGELAAGRQPTVHVSPEPAFRIGYKPLSPLFREGFRCFKGSNWFTLSRRAVEHLVRFIRNNPAVCRYYRNVQFAAGESIYTTVLLNAPNLKLVANDNKRFVRWTRPTTGHPDLLGAGDVPEMIASGKHFARKIDSRNDPRILDLLDQNLGVTSRVTPARV